MATTIGVKMQMDGAAQFKADLQQITQKSKELAAEMKAAASGANDEAQKQKILAQQIENARNKIDALNKKYDAQKRALEESNAELEQAKQVYGEDSDEVQKLTLAVTKQETALSKTKTEINKATAELNKFESQADETADETEDLAQAEGKAGDGADKLKGGFSVLKGALADLAADGIRKCVDGLKELMTAGPEFADNILTLAQKTGLATDTLQEFEYMSGLIDVDVSTIAGSMKKLTKSMDSARGGTGATADAFATLGISVTDANGNLRDNEDVFYDTIDALGKVQNETERDALAMQIFGKSATDLNPLIEAGSDAMKGFAAEARDMGYVLDESSLDALGRVQDEFDRFQKQMEGVKNQIASGVAPAIERGMKKLSEVIKKIDWKKVGDQMGKAFNKLIDALDWIVEHGALVKSLLTGIVTAMAAKKVASFVSSLASMTSALKAATVAQEGMNAAANANPYVLLATAIIALTAAAVTFGSELAKTRFESSALGQEIIALQSEMEEMSNKTADAISSFQEMESTKEESIASTIAQTEHLGKLTDELGTLVDANGEVKESDQARAEFILGQLNEALGTEYTMNDLINGQYQEIIQSVNDLIEAQRVKAILASQEEAYAQAVTGLADAETLLAQNVQQRIDKQNEVAQLEAEIAQLEQDQLYHSSVSTQAQIDDKRELVNELNASIEQMKGDYAGLADTVDGYMYNINQYESNWEAAHNQHYDAIDTKSWEVAKSMGEAGNEYSTAVATSSVKASNSWMDELGNMLTETSGTKVEFQSEGNGMVKMLVNGIQQGKSLPANQVKLMAQGMVQNADVKGQMETSGLNAVLGFSNSVHANSYLASGAGRQLAQEFINAVKATMDEGSPSKVMRHSGLMAVLGFTNEIRDDLSMVSQAGAAMASSFADSFNPSANYSAMLNGTSNGVYLPNGVGSTSNSVVLNIYGAEGQNVNALADIVIDKIQRTITGSEAVYA